jgi:hypothetical protein
MRNFESIIRRKKLRIWNVFWSSSKTEFSRVKMVIHMRTFSDFCSIYRSRQLRLIFQLMGYPISLKQENNEKSKSAKKRNASLRRFRAN